jgi:hypothetical protein
MSLNIGSLIKTGLDAFSAFAAGGMNPMADMKAFEDVMNLLQGGDSQSSGGSNLLSGLGGSPGGGSGGLGDVGSLIGDFASL